MRGATIHNKAFKLHLLKRQRNVFFLTESSKLKCDHCIRVLLLGRELLDPGLIKFTELHMVYH